MDIQIYWYQIGWIDNNVRPFAERRSTGISKCRLYLSTVSRGFQLNTPVPTADLVETRNKVSLSR